MKLKKFLMFLVVLIVCVSLGMLVYYFVRNDEVITFNTNEIYINEGGKVTLEDLGYTVENENDKTVYDFNAGGDDVTEYISYNEDLGAYVAQKGGTVTITITTSNSNYPSFSITINIGDGTVGNPYLISTEEELRAIGNSSIFMLNDCYRLTSNITLTDEFTPIGTIVSGESIVYQGFTGYFDGNDKTIDGLTIESDYKYAGLFSYITSSAVVSNLTISNAVINGAFEQVGTLAGHSSAGSVIYITISSTSITNTMTETAPYTGMLLGRLYTEANSSTADVTFCNVNGSIISDGYVGGLIGGFENAYIRITYATGSITAYTAEAVNIMGGLIGTMSIEINGYKRMVAESYVDILVNNSYFDGDSVYGAIIGSYNGPETLVSGTSEVALSGLVACDYGTSITAIGSGEYNVDYSAYILSKDVMQSSIDTASQYYILYLNTNFETVSWQLSTYWYSSGGYLKYRSNLSISNKDITIIYEEEDEDADDNTGDSGTGDGGTGDSGVLGNYIQITTAEELSNIGSTGDYIIMNDIDMNGATWNSLSNFTGTITGGHTYNGDSTYRISDLVIYDNGTSAYVGMFNSFSGSISSIIFEDIEVNTTADCTNVGILTGRVYDDAEINNITFINCEINTSASNVGLLAGYAEKSTIDNIYITSSIIKNTIEGSDIYTGGVVGYSTNKVEIEDVYITGLEINANGIIGGVTGILNLSTSSLNDVEIESSIINVTNDATMVGGAIGTCVSAEVDDINISMEINIGSISSSVNVGGVIGQNSGILDTLYFSGTIVSTATKAQIGGVVGFNSGTVEYAGNSGTITANALAYYSIGGGIVGKNVGTLDIAINTGNVTAFVAGGIAGYNAASSDSSNIKYSATDSTILSTVKTGIISNAYSAGVSPYDDNAYIFNSGYSNTITGIVVGGLVGYMPSGVLKYGYTQSYLCNSTEPTNMGTTANSSIYGTVCAVKGGYVGYLPKTAGEYTAFGLVYDCITACTFDGNKKMATYLEVGNDDLLKEKSWLNSLLNKDYELMVTGRVSECFIFTNGSINSSMGTSRTYADSSPISNSNYTTMDCETTEDIVASMFSEISSNWTSIDDGLIPQLANLGTTLRSYFN